MQFFIVLSALVAAAVAAPSAVWSSGLVPAQSSVVQGVTADIVGPSGRLVANTGSISQNSVAGASVSSVVSPAAVAVTPGLVSRSVVVGAPGVIGVNNLGLAPWGINGLALNGLVAPGLIGTNLLGHGLGHQVILG